MDKVGKEQLARVLENDWFVRRGNGSRFEPNAIQAFLQRTGLPRQWERMTEANLDDFITWLQDQLNPPEPYRTVYEILLGEG